MGLTLSYQTQRNTQCPLAPSFTTSRCSPLCAGLEEVHQELHLEDCDCFQMTGHEIERQHNTVLPKVAAFRPIAFQYQTQKVNTT